MKIKVHAFNEGDSIPSQFSKRGGNRSPAMAFDDVPREAKSLALIMDDPDAPSGLFTHWVVFNINPAVPGFGENQVPFGARQGHNSWDEPRYGGPQPPDREHRYFFHLYALDRELTLTEGATRDAVERAMEGHVIAEATYMGRYAPDTAEIAAHR